jgi:hypothetical protein
LKFAGETTEWITLRTASSSTRPTLVYVVQSLPENATSTLDILKSWQFI